MKKENQKILVKTGLCIGFFLFGALSVFGQNAKKIVRPEPVESFENNRLSNGKYNTNELKYRKLTEAKPKMEEAWLNRYVNERYSYFDDRSNALSVEETTHLNNTANEALANIAGSFSGHYIQFLEGNYSDEAFGSLNLAASIDHDNPLILDEMLAMSQIYDLKEVEQKYLNLLKSSSKYSSSVRTYGKNVLAFAEQNSVIITHGHEDHYPMMIAMAQSGKNIQLINVQYFRNETYLKKIAEQFDLKTKDLDGDLYSAVESILKRGRHSGAMYLSLTLPPEFLKAQKSKLTPAGMLLQWQGENTAAELEQIWNTQCDKTYYNLKEPINRNYVLLFSILKQHYYASGMDELGLEMNENLVRIAQMPMR